MSALSFRAYAVLVFLLGLSLQGAAFANTMEEFVAKVSLTSSKSAKTVDFSTAEGDFPTFNVDPKDGFQVALTVPKTLVGKAIQIRADDGGVVKGASNGVFSAIADGEDGLLKFDYFLGGTTGRYTLKIIAPGYMQVLEFWVGKPRPQASPGPARASPSKENPKP